MNTLGITVGIGFITLGLWLSIVQIKFFAKGKRDALGGHVRMLIAGIGLIAFGIIELIKDIW